MFFLKFIIFIFSIGCISSCTKQTSLNITQEESITFKNHRFPKSKKYYTSGKYNKCFECPDSAYQKYNPKKTFDDYQTELYFGQKKKINYQSNRLAREYRTVITNGYAELDINFGGHYVLITWGCGSPCSSGAIVDAKTGSVYAIPTTGFGYSYRNNSTLLLCNPPDEKNYNYIFEDYSTEVIEYIWNEKAKKFIEIELD